MVSELAGTFADEGSWAVVGEGRYDEGVDLNAELEGER